MKAPAKPEEIVEALRNGGPQQRAEALGELFPSDAGVALVRHDGKQMHVGVSDGAELDRMHTALLFAIGQVSKALGMSLVLQAIPSPREMADKIVVPGGQVPPVVPMKK